MIRTGKLNANASVTDGDYPFFTCSKNVSRIDSWKYDCECVLVAGNGDLNVKYYKGKFDAYQRTYIVEPSKESLLNCRYLYYFMSLYLEQLRKMTLGGVIQYIKLSFLTEAIIPLPPLPEQERIVAILDEAFGAIATATRNAERNLANAQALFEIQLEKTVLQPDGVCKDVVLGDICDLQNGYAFKSGDYIKRSKTLNIRMSNIRPGGAFDPEHNQRCLPDSYAEQYSDYLLKDGDLIIAMTDMAGEPKILGVPTLVSNRNGRAFLLNQRVGKLFSFSGNVRVPYLRYALTCPSVKRYYKDKGAGGLQINISKKQILTLPIRLPSLASQDRAVLALQGLAKLCRNLGSVGHEKLQSTYTLKQSLLHKAFTGELTADKQTVDRTLAEAGV